MSTFRLQGSLYTRFSGPLAIVEFGHPSSNSMTSELLSRLADTFHTLGENQEVHAILLQSEGERAFCAGASFDELLEVSSPEESSAFFSGFARLINAMRSCPKIIIGRIHGKAVGGGVGIIAACDYALASEKASVRLSELRLGIAPLVIAPAVLRKTGPSGLGDLSLEPTTWQSAYWAREKGLYSRVFESRTELDSEAEHFAAQVAQAPKMALENLKKALWEGTDHWPDLLAERAEETGRLALSEITQQTLRKFKDKKGR